MCRLCSRGGRRSVMRACAYAIAESAYPQRPPDCEILVKMWSSELQALMDAAVDAVILIDDRGRIGAINLSTQRLFGFSVDQLLGKNVSMLMPEPYRSAHDSYLARYAATGVPHIIGVGREIEAQRKDGSVFPAFISVGRVPGAQPPRFVGFVRDITAQ